MIFWIHVYLLHFRDLCTTHAALYLFQRKSIKRDFVVVSWNFKQYSCISACDSLISKYSSSWKVVNGLCAHNQCTHYTDVLRILVYFSISSSHPSNKCMGKCLKTLAYVQGKLPCEKRGDCIWGNQNIGKTCWLVLLYS